MLQDLNNTSDNEGNIFLGEAWAETGRLERNRRWCHLLNLLFFRFKFKLIQVSKFVLRGTYIVKICKGIA